VEIGDATDQGFKKQLVLYLYPWIIKVGFRTRLGIIEVAGTVFKPIFNPQPNPQNAMSYTTSANLAVPAVC
jgi:hypothetical protein